MGPFQRRVTQYRGEGRVTKKVTSDVGGGFAAKKNVIPLIQKTPILRVTFFLNGPYDDDLLYYSL